MAITRSVGYAGTIDAEEWAKLSALALGVQYGVRDNASWRPTIGGGGDRAVTIGPGVGWGQGVIDTNDAPVTLNMPSVSSGSRWYLIVARRVWGTKVTSFQRVTGSSVKQLPTRMNIVGTEDEQPIALVRVAAGSATIAELIDLRVIPGDGGPLLGFDSLACQYLTRPGTSVRIGDLDWTLTINSMGNAEWVSNRARRIETAAGVLVGPVLPEGAALIEKTGVTGLISTNANGDTSIQYPAAFPNGVLFASLERYGYGSLGSTTQVLATSQTLARLNFRVYRSDGVPLVSAPNLRYAYRVVGW